MPASNADPGAAPLGVAVAISTLGAGLARIRLPAPRPGLTYLILLQCPEAADPGIRKVLEERVDTRVLALEGRGLSRSRNAALAQADQPLVLFADDDQVLDPVGIMVLAQAFVQDPGLALAAGWRAERLPSRARAHRLTRLNSGRICAPEFMVRLAAIRAADLRFDTEFGLGARYPVAEDYIFVCDILRAGLAGMSLPVVTGSHPHDSTGDNWSDPDLMRARQAMISRVFGPWAPLMRLAYALKHRRRMGGVGRAVRFVLANGRRN
ncbi:MAG: glycosyltransferase [Rhodobacteraceae bacterium]|nr:glycosyltransferase [Paracoccaceae bacterium]